MRTLCIASLLFFICCIPVRAQLGWQWGIGSYAGTVSIGANEAFFVATDRAGNVFQAGTNGFYNMVYDTFHIANPYGGTQLIISKVDSSGSVKWVVHSDSGSVLAPGYVVTDTAGNLYYFGGYFQGNFKIDTYRLIRPTSIPYMAFMMKISPAGVILWAKNLCAYEYDPFYGLGGLGIDDSGYIYVGASFRSNITIGGTALTNTDLSGSTSDLFLAKFNSQGNAIWAKKMGGIDEERCMGIAVTRSGNIYLCGQFKSDTLSTGSLKLGNSAPGNYDSYLAKFDRKGNPVYIKEINRHMVQQAIATDNSGNVYTTGNFNAQVVLGTDTLRNTALSTDVFLAKYNPAGSIKWARSAGGVLNEQGQNIVIDQCGTIWLAGQLGNTGGNFGGYSMNFSGHTIAEPPGSLVDPTFVAQYDTLGNYLKCVAMPSGSDDFMGLAVDNRGNFYVGGDYWQTGMVFGNDTLQQNGSVEELFLAKYKFDSLACNCYFTPFAAAFTTSGDGTVSFTYTGTTTYDSLRWDFGDGAFSTATNPTHTYAHGTYTACVTIFSQCAADGYNTYCKTMQERVGIAGATNGENITLFPNPAGAEFTIQSDQPFPGNAIAELYGISGQFIKRVALAGTATAVPTADLVPGIYLCRITAGDSCLVKKVIVGSR